MFRFLAKSALAAVIWKRYRRIILSTLALFVGYFLISLLHGDYVDYVVTAGDRRFLWGSYVAKWAALTVITLVYYLYAVRVLARRPGDDPPPATQRRASPPEGGNVLQSGGEADPFAGIRRKKTLESRGDVLLKSRLETREKEKGERTKGNSG